MLGRHHPFTHQSLTLNLCSVLKIILSCCWQSSISPAHFPAYARVIRVGGLGMARDGKHHRGHALATWKATRRCATRQAIRSPGDSTKVEATGVAVHLFVACALDPSARLTQGRVLKSFGRLGIKSPFFAHARFPLPGNRPAQPRFQADHRLHQRGLVAPVFFLLTHSQQGEKAHE